MAIAAFKARQWAEIEHLKIAVKTGAQAAGGARDAA
jgi:hypothetical protein